MFCSRNIMKVTRLAKYWHLKDYGNLINICLIPLTDLLKLYKKVVCTVLTFIFNLLICEGYY